MDVIVARPKPCHSEGELRSDQTHPSSTAKVEPGKDEIREQLERILANRGFVSSPARREMLRYVVEQTLAGHDDLLKGTAIGLAVFGRDADFDQTSDPIVRIEARRLRRDLDTYYMGSGTDDPVRISIPKGGYRPQFDVRPAVSAVSPPDPPAPVGGAQSARRSGAGAWVGRMAAGLLAVVLLGLGASLLLQGREEGRVDPVAASAVSPPSVLVRPFEARSADASDQYLADGVTETLIASLMHFPDLRLYSVGDSFRLRDGEDTSLSPSEDATFTVEGSVRTEAGRVQVLARMTDGNQRVLWSGSFLRELTGRNFLALQDEIASEIASALGQPYGVIRTTLARDLSDLPDPDLSGFACVLKAYDYRRTSKTELYRPTRDCLEAAVKADPEYAEAWAMLTYLRMDAGRYGYDEGVSRESAFKLASDAGVRALALDPQNVQALKALSFISHYTGNYAQAQELARRALDANPYDPDTMAQLGWRLAVRGNFAEGIPYMRDAVERSINPAPWYFHMIAIDHLMRQEYPQMLEAAERASADGSSISQSLLAIAHGALGHQLEADKALELMARKWPLLGEDPAAAYAVHHVSDEISAAIVSGLEQAGWDSPKR
ncbi:hypothetical protein [Tropicimonas sp. IMCC34043]|uniref:hypothetical protein n=1 Tax=Tropicimonas sp. IMCC34043 TaxID=2248760 RepID=UPI000E26B508|nr:hypothetical protein [Tropicimonas sp. IMCC34043]